MRKSTSFPLEKDGDIEDDINGRYPFIGANAAQLYKSALATVGNNIELTIRFYTKEQIVLKTRLQQKGRLLIGSKTSECYSSI